MEELVIGLYALSLIACCVGLWLWYEVDRNNLMIAALRAKLREMDGRIQTIESKRR